MKNLKIPFAICAMLIAQSVFAQQTQIIPLPADSTTAGGQAVVAITMPVMPHVPSSAEIAKIVQQNSSTGLCGAATSGSWIRDRYYTPCQGYNPASACPPGYQQVTTGEADGVYFLSCSTTATVYIPPPPPPPPPAGGWSSGGGGGY